MNNIFSLDARRRQRAARAELEAKIHWVKALSEAMVGDQPGVMVLMFSPNDEEISTEAARPPCAVLLTQSEVLHLGALFSHYPEPGAALPFEISRAGVWVKIEVAGADATGQIFTSQCGLVGESAPRYKQVLSDARLMLACRGVRAIIRTKIRTSPNVDIEDLILHIDTRIATLDLMIRGGRR